MLLWAPEKRNYTDIMRFWKFRVIKESPPRLTLVVTRKRDVSANIALKIQLSVVWSVPTGHKYYTGPLRSKRAWYNTFWEISRSQRTFLRGKGDFSAYIAPKIPISVSRKWFFCKNSSQNLVFCSWKCAKKP